jgi:DNA-binding transcriptional ArsR family regulator
MFEGPDISEAAALMGDPARSRMLTALLDRRAWTATELACEAGVGSPTASAHLAKLLAGGLVSDVRQGRHRYFRLADDDVALALESLLVLSKRASSSKRLPGPRNVKLCRARTCYGHLAGDMGVRLFDHLQHQGWVIAHPSGWRFSEIGLSAFADWLGIPVPRFAGTGRNCIDWSERREHLGGGLGKHVFEALEEARFVVAGENRSIEFTPLGEAKFCAISPK